MAGRHRRIRRFAFWLGAIAVLGGVSAWGAGWERLADPPDELSYHPALWWMTYPIPDTKLAADDDRSIYLISQKPYPFPSTMSFYRFDVVDNSYESLPAPPPNHYSGRWGYDQLQSYFSYPELHAAWVDNHVLTEVASDACGEFERCFGLFDVADGQWTYLPLETYGRLTALTADAAHETAYFLTAPRGQLYRFRPPRETEPELVHDTILYYDLYDPTLSVVDNTIYAAGGLWLYWEPSPRPYFFQVWGRPTSDLYVLNQIGEVLVGAQGPSSIADFASFGDGWGERGLHILGASVQAGWTYWEPYLFGLVFSGNPTHQIYSPDTRSWSFGEPLPTDCLPMDGETQGRWLYGLFRCWDDAMDATDMRLYRLDVGHWSTHSTATSTTTTTTVPPSDDDGDDASGDDEVEPLGDHGDAGDSGNDPERGCGF